MNSGCQHQVISHSNSSDSLKRRGGIAVEGSREDVVVVVVVVVVEWDVVGEDILYSYG